MEIQPGDVTNPSPMGEHNPLRSMMLITSKTCFPWSFLTHLNATFTTYQTAENMNTILLVGAL